MDDHEAIPDAFAGTPVSGTPAAWCGVPKYGLCDGFEGWLG